MLVGCTSSMSEQMPNEEDFFLEVLDPMPRSTSGSFHSYSKDSYYVDKIRFWSEFPDFARDHGHNPRAVLIVGPVGVLWTYYVFVLLEEENGFRINEVIFPHSRLTKKWTALLSEDEALARISRFESITGVRAVDTTPEGFRAESGDKDNSDFEFNLLLVWLSDPEEVFVADIPWVIDEETEDVSRSALEQLDDALSKLTSGMEQTY